MEYIVLIFVVLIILSLFRNKKRVRTGLKQTKSKITKSNLPANCPYCKFTFEKRPQRNRKCPKCQCKIILRKGKLLSEHQAEAYDRKENKKIGRRLAILQRKSLINYQKLGVVKYVEISSACDGVTCHVCNQLNGKHFLLKKELRNPTLPVVNCESDFCRCSYLPVV